MSLRWKISIKQNFALTYKLNTFQIEFLFTSQYIQRKSWNTFIWITYPWCTLIVDWSLDVKKDNFRPQEEDAEILGPEVPYISVIDTLMYFANCTWTYRSNPQLMGNIDAWYLSDPYKWRSETKYYSLVTTLLLHEDLSSKQRCRNS